MKNYCYYFLHEYKACVVTWFSLTPFFPPAGAHSSIITPIVPVKSRGKPHARLFCPEARYSILAICYTVWHKVPRKTTPLSTHQGNVKCLPNAAPLNVCASASPLSAPLQNVNQLNTVLLLFVLRAELDCHLSYICWEFPPTVKKNENKKCRKTSDCCGWFTLYIFK